MNWKSTAVVSGATLLAGWFASVPPSPAVPQQAAVPVSPGPRAALAASDIERQAERLQTRLSGDTSYAGPARNLFRFGPKAPVSVAPEPKAPEAAPIVETPAAPPSPAVTLEGVASDQVNGQLVRTAILGSPSGVLLVNAGDEVLSRYRVASVTDDAVELTPLADGDRLRLTLSGSR